MEASRSKNPGRVSGAGLKRMKSLLDDVEVPDPLEAPDPLEFAFPSAMLTSKRTFLFSVLIFSHFCQYSSLLQRVGKLSQRLPSTGNIVCSVK